MLSLIFFEKKWKSTSTKTILKSVNEYLYMYFVKNAPLQNAQSNYSVKKKKSLFKMYCKSLLIAFLLLVEVLN